MSLRAAAEADAKLMFAWQCDERTRKYARNSNKPTWEDHLAWVKRYLTSNGRLFIIRHNYVDAGILRLDPDSNGAHEVTIVIAPQFYRAGVAVPALRIAHAEIEPGKLTAEVLDGNEASQRMLIEAGYKYLGCGHYVQRSITEVQ